MKSLVFIYVDEEGEERITAGNYAYYQSIAKTCKQIACCMSIEHSEEERYEMSEMELDELTTYLETMMFDNPEMLYFPS